MPSPDLAKRLAAIDLACAIGDDPVRLGAWFLFAAPPSDRALCGWLPPTLLLPVVAQ